MSFWMVPLNCSGRYALLFGSHDIKRHDRQHGAVHGHRHRHLIQRNPPEQYLHVEDGVDCHARLAHVARHALVIGIVSAMRGQVERYRNPALPRREIAPVKRIGLFGSRKPRVLPDGPRPHGIHGAVWPAQIRRNSRRVLEVFERGQIPARIKTLQRDVLRRKPLFGLLPVARSLRRLCPCRKGGGTCRLPIDLCKIRTHH